MDKVSADDFQKLDIRIGTVMKAEVPSWSHWVTKLTVDFGPEVQTRTVFAGIMKFYDVKDVEGKQFPFVVNMEPKKIGPEGDFSEGMMLAASVPTEETDPTSPEELRGAGERPMLFNLSEKVPNGAKVR